MTTPEVPTVPPLPTRSEILSGRPVRGRTWASVAELYNFALAQGRTLVPLHTPTCDVAAGGTETLTFTTWPGIHALKRLWVLQLTAGPWVITVPSGGQSYAAFVASSLSHAAPRIIEQDLTVPDSGETVIDIDVTYNGTGTGTVKSIGCFELPRALLEGGTTANANTEYGVLAASMTAQEQVYFDSANPANSLGSVALAASVIANHVTRGGMYSFWSATDAGALRFAAAGPVVLQVVDPIFLGVKKLRNDSVSELVARCYVKASDGATAGTVTFTASSGDSVVVTIAAGTTSYTWLPASGGAFDVHAEDLSAADGRRSSSWCTVAITGDRTAGAGTIYVKGLAVGHASP